MRRPQLGLVMLMCVGVLLSVVSASAAASLSSRSATRPRLAHAAAVHVNAVLPRFQAGFGFSNTPSYSRASSVVVRYDERHEDLFIRCLRCTGAGQFTKARNTAHSSVFKVKGDLYLTSKSRLAVAITRPDHIGRVDLYRVSISRASDGYLVTKPVVAIRACLAANTLGPSMSTIDEILRDPPLVPCHAPRTRDSRLALALPAELLGDVTRRAAIAGVTSGPRWLAIFRAPTCYYDAEAEMQSGRAYGHLFHQVRGRFEYKFRTGTANRSGHYCIYVQDGGLYRGVPDGRVIHYSFPRYYTGDRIVVHATPTVASGQPATDVIRGFAARPETLWAFSASAPCKFTALAESKVAAGAFHAGVRGSVSQRIETPPLTQGAYQCVYLQLGLQGDTPSATAPTLVGDSALVQVSP